MSGKRHTIKSTLIKVGSGFFVFVVAQALAAMKTAMGDKVDGSTVVRVLVEAATYFISWELFEALRETVFSFTLTSLGCVVIGTLLALLVHFVPAAAFVETAISFLRPIPAIAMIAVGVLLLSTTSPWLGLFVAFLGALWPYTVTALEAFRRVPLSMHESAITLGKSKRQYVLGVLSRAALPGLFSSIRLAFPIALLLTVTAEYLFPNLGGLGAALFDKQSGLEYPQVLCIIAVLSAVGWAVEAGFETLERHAVPWAHAMDGEDAVPSGQRVS